MNLIDSASVRVLVDEVYEKHYARYKAYFGNTIAGFFSDEPELGNVNGYPFDNTLGQKDRKLPWSRRKNCGMPGEDSSFRIFRLYGILPERRRLMCVRCIWTG